MKRSLTLLTMFVVPVATLIGAACSGAPTSVEAELAGPAAASCESLTSLVLPGTTINQTEAIAAGAFVPPVAAGGRAPSTEAVASTYGGLPAFCRVVATLTPSDDSEIKVEVWLPASDWNGKYQAVGNGAFTGSIRHGSMAAALARGYATSSTDTGHTGNTASFGLGHPEKVVDFGWRSIHEMTVTTKAIVAAHYEEGPRYSYWNGCSAGGRQAMKLAQRFPEDFDGIVAGAPGQDWTGRAAGALKVATVLDAHEAARLSEEDRLLVHTAALDACDKADGIADGVIDNPEACDFDPAVLQCSGANEPSCLTATQVDTVRMLYSSPANPKTGRAITGLVPGSELNWTDMGWTQSARDTGLEQYRYLVYADPEWTIDRFDFDTDIVKAEEADNDTLNALDPNLQPFFDRGGKLMAYHGWSDAQISPLNATQYYQRVVEAVGNVDAVHDSYRLFMAPGMGHCGRGEGPSVFDKMAPIEAWVERGEAPDSIVATRLADGVVDRARPLCPYPQLAVYTGSGSTDDAENFVCQMP